MVSRNAKSNGSSPATKPDDVIHPIVAQSQPTRKGPEVPKEDGDIPPGKITPLFRHWFPMNELEVGDLFMKEHGRDVLWCPEEQRWYVWDGRIWRSECDENGLVHRWVKRLTRSLLSRAAKIDDDVFREKAAKFAAQCQKDKLIAAVMRTVKCEVNVTLDQFDSDQMLLNVQNGTINLRTGQLQPFTREDYITFIAPTIYDATAASPQQWLDFVGWTCRHSADLTAYKHRLAGSCLSGVAGDQKVLIDYGEGSNGKSSFWRTIQMVLGKDYVVTIPVDSILANARGHNASAPSADIMSLKGARLALTGEVEDGQHLAEGLVKLLSGGDYISARSPYGRKQVIFRPTHKLVMFTNNLPIIRDTGHGIWRRIRVLPSAANIDEDVAAGRRQKKTDDETDAAFRLEASGILNWLVAGCLTWQRDGLGSCPEIETATNEYRANMDIIGIFIREYVESHAELDRITVKELYVAYREWSEETGRGRTTLSKQRFDDHMKKRLHCTPVRMGKGGTFYWEGLDAIKYPPQKAGGDLNATQPPAPLPATMVCPICYQESDDTAISADHHGTVATCPHCGNDFSPAFGRKSYDARHKGA